MARYDHLPIWRDAVRLATVLEEAVRRFPRYQKSEIGWPSADPLAASSQASIFQAVSPSGV